MSSRSMSGLSGLLRDKNAVNRRRSVGSRRRLMAAHGACHLKAGTCWQTAPLTNSHRRRRTMCFRGRLCEHGNARTPCVKSPAEPEMGGARAFPRQAPPLSQGGAGMVQLHCTILAPLMSRGLATVTV